MFRKFRIYVPDSRRNVYAVKDAINTARLVAGGQTDVAVTGSWISDGGEVVTEPVTIVEYLIEKPELGRSRSKFEIFEAKVRDLVAALKASGEESVLVEIQDVIAVFE